MNKLSSMWSDNIKPLVIALPCSIVAGYLVAHADVICGHVVKDFQLNYNFSQNLRRSVESAATNDVVRSTLESKGLHFELKTDEASGTTNYVVSAVEVPETNSPVFSSGM